jgi:hypothetical protein
MPLSRRYTPEHPPSEACTFGLDFSAVVPPGVGISQGRLDIFTNVVPPVAADADWTKGVVSVRGRVLYATLSGGVAGTDYLLRWTATDTDGNVWPRSGLILVGSTS